MGYLTMLDEEVALSVNNIIKDDKISMRASAVVANKANDPDVIAAVTNHYNVLKIKKRLHCNTTKLKFTAAEP